MYPRIYQAKTEIAPGPARRADPFRRLRTDRDHGRRRERMRKDDLHRQTDAHVPFRWQESDLGAADTFRAAAVAQLTVWPTAWAPKSSPARRAAIRPAWRIAQWPGRSNPPPMFALSIPPGDCKPNKD